MQPILWAAMVTGFTFLMTALGSALVFFFRKQASVRAQRICLGFAAGVMIAASIWSLLNPAIEEAEAAGGIGWIPAAGGFVLGIAFLVLLDVLLPHLHLNARQPEGLRASWRRSTLLTLSVTLHNIPEGMAVGLAFAMAAQHGGGASTLSAAAALAIGMVLAAPYIGHLMPWFLSFAAGAMLYVVVEELIPEARLGEHSNAGTLAVMAGFLLMMVLDVALG